MEEHCFVSLSTIRNPMETNPLKINTRDKKGKYLLGIIKEMDNGGNSIKIEPNILEDITTGLELVKKIQSGELPKRSVKQMLQGK